MSVFPIEKVHFYLFYISSVRLWRMSG